MIAGNGMMRAGARLALLAALAAVLAPGCKRGTPAAAPSASTQAANSAEVTAVRNAMTRGMTAITLDALTDAHVGKRCVVVARTPEQVDRQPPPLGMVRRMGETTIYSAEIHEVSSGSLKIRAAYPTSNNLKIIEIPQADIESIHVAP